jgi:hypothetical protein
MKWTAIIRMGLACSLLLNLLTCYYFLSAESPKEQKARITNVVYQSTLLDYKERITELLNEPEVYECLNPRIHRVLTGKYSRDLPYPR